MKITEIKKKFKQKGYDLKQLPNGKVAFYNRKGKHTLTFDSYTQAYNDFYKHWITKPKIRKI